MSVMSRSETGVLLTLKAVLMSSFEHVFNYFIYSSVQYKSFAEKDGDC